MKSQRKPTAPTLPKRAAANPAKVAIHRLRSGVDGLDEILSGGIPEFSFNIIGGMPGCGKTTLAPQLSPHFLK